MDVHLLSVLVCGSILSENIKKTWIIVMSENSLSKSLNYQSWMVLFAIGILVFLINIDYTAVNLALVPIAEEIDGELNSLQWLLSGYILIWAAFVVPAGRLADLYGKRYCLIVGIGVFIIASIMVGMGHNIYILILGRLLQGLGAAIFSSPAYGLVFSSVPPNKQGMAMGFIGGASGFGLAAGPTIAGWIIKEIGWRWIFYINIPLCFLVVVILMFYASAEKREENAARIDWISVVLLSFGLGFFVFALNQIEVWGIGDLRLLGMGLLGIFLLGYFFYHDRHQPFQTLPRSFFRNKSFVSIVVICFLTAYCFSLVLVMLGLYLQNTLHLTSSQTGLYFLSMTLAVGILSPFGGKMADHMDIRIPMIAGAVLTAIALFVLSLFDATSSPLFVCGGLLLAGLGLGIGFPSLNTALFRTLESNDINTGSGIFTMAMMLGNSLSVIVSTSLLVMFGRFKLFDLVGQEGLSISSDEFQLLAGVLAQVEHTSEQLVGFPSEQIPLLLKMIDQSFLYGYSLNLLIGMVLSVISTFVILVKLGRLDSQKS